MTPRRAHRATNDAVWHCICDCDDATLQPWLRCSQFVLAAYRSFNGIEAETTALVLIPIRMTPGMQRRGLDGILHAPQTTALSLF